MKTLRLISVHFLFALFKRVVPVFTPVLLSTLAIGQATTNISGIVNTYYRAIEIIPAKACIRVASITGLNIDSKVMVIQMKGAGIITSNNSSFGDTTSLNEAGNYEIGTICHINGDSVFLFHDLLNTYSPAAGKVQVVQFAEYYSADVVDTVKAMPWNNATGLGGVIAIYCEQDIILHKPISADSSGFSGGAYIVSNGTCSNPGATGYIYNASSTSPQNGAYKGEGIADVTSAQSGGRGAPANGGGGGNNHNNGGGGGANLDAGGIGGGNSSSAGCTNTLRGLAGKSLSNWNGQKIFLGGGGGAGHSNNGLSFVGGGNGGGIVFIWATNLNGNGNFIKANGTMGGSSLSDGAGAGGAGGTIILNVSNYTSAVSIQANGGAGGNSNDGANIGRCYGAGGGGSGGVIYFNGALPAVTISSSGGTAGIESSRDVSCAAIQAPAAGDNGQIISSYTFTRSTNPAGYCELLLPVKLVSFTATFHNQQVQLIWEVQNPELASEYIIEKSDDLINWYRLKNVPGDELATRYMAMDQTLLTGKIYYRIRIIEKGNHVAYSPVRAVDVAVKNEFLMYPNPANDQINITYSRIPYQLKLTDNTGRMIMKQTILTNTSTLDIRSLQRGLYFISINGMTQKLLVQ